MTTTMSRRRPDLVLIDHCSGLGGAQISKDALRYHLLERGVAVASLMPTRTSWLPLPLKRKARGLPALGVNSLFFLIRYFRMGRPLLYCNSFWDRIQCLLLPSAKTVTHLRDVPRPWQTRLLRFLPSRAYVVSSTFMRRKLRRVLPPDAVIHLVPNIVDGAAPDASRLRPALRPFRLIMVANLAPWKNHLAGLEALEWLRERGVPATLDVWGSDILGENPEYRERLLHRLQALPSGTARLVEGLRILPEDYRRYHCLLHPAQEEPFGRVVVEAMLNGLPVIGLDSGNTTDLLEEYQAGILYPDNRPEKIGEAVWYMFCHYADFTAAVEKCADRLRRNHSAEAALHALRRLGLFASAGPGIREGNLESEVACP